MSTPRLFSFFLLLSFLLYISCSLIHRPIDTVSSQDENHLQDEHTPLMIYPKYASVYRFQRSPFNHPRTSRNSWFRVSTYQHMKPNGESEEKAAGDNLMRWG